MNPEFYITDEQIAKAREKGACDPALTWAEKERDWRKISADCLGWDAANTKLCPLEVLIELFRNEDTDVRCSVARHPNTPAEVLTILSKDLDWPVRVFVAENPNTPIRILTELSKDNWYVRCSVARNPNTPTEVLFELSKDSSGYIRNLIYLIKN